MFTLHLDIETFCDLPLAKCGAHRYAERAEVMLVQHAWGDGPVDVWETAERPTWAEDLQYLIDEAEEVVIHNSAFERSVLAKHGVIIPVEKIDDTMVVALQHGLPGSLGMLCDILGVPRDLAKDKDGKKLIQLFCQPRPKNVKLRRATKETHPDEWTRFLEYARLDVDAMRDVRRRTPRWNCTESERHFWRLDQRINDRGFAVDMALARGALRAFDRASRTLATRAAEITGGVVTSTTQRDKLIEYLASIGCKTFDLTKDTVSDMLTRYTDERVVELLQIRQQASATSPAKYKALLGAACEDDRLRGSIQFCGAARTGRDAGRIFQPQNLPRPSMGAAAIEVAIDAMKADCEDLLYNNVSEVCVNAVRGSLVAPVGRKLVVADLSNIEGRVLAWLAGEVWKIKAFSEYDRGTGHDLYVLAYARAFNLEPQVVVDNKKTGDGRMRQIGKVMELALGFQGGLGAFTTMGGTTAKELGDDAIDDIVRAWRRAHPNIQSFWYELEGAAKQAIRNPGEGFVVRDLVLDLKTDEWGVDWLRMRLPSGRYLCYMRAHLDEHKCGTCDGKGNVVVGGTMEDPSEPRRVVCPACAGAGTWGTGAIRYEGVNQYTRQWTTLDTYGGKLTENAVQAIARDVLFAGMQAAEEAGYAVVLRVHDELVTEVPDTPEWSDKDLSGLMATNPPWAAGLPLAAAGFEGYRYRKD